MSTKVLIGQVAGQEVRRADCLTDWLTRHSHRHPHPHRRRSRSRSRGELRAIAQRFQSF